LPQSCGQIPKIRKISGFNMGQAAKKNALLKSARKKRVIVCEDLDFVWDEPELLKMARMWERSASVETIANHFKRDPDEVLIALLHLAREDQIKARKLGLKGAF
jgi:glycosyltransferase involved in cell wall biosynthesis